MEIGYYKKKQDKKKILEKVEIKNSIEALKIELKNSAPSCKKRIEQRHEKKFKNKVQEA